MWQESSGCIFATTCCVVIPGWLFEVAVSTCQQRGVPVSQPVHWKHTGHLPTPLTHQQNSIQNENVLSCMPLTGESSQRKSLELSLGGYFCLSYLEFFTLSVTHHPQIIFNDFEAQILKAWILKIYTHNALQLFLTRYLSLWPWAPLYLLYNTRSTRRTLISRSQQKRYWLDSEIPQLEGKILKGNNVNRKKWGAFKQNFSHFWSQNLLIWCRSHSNEQSSWVWSSSPQK